MQIFFLNIKKNIKSKNSFRSWKAALNANMVIYLNSLAFGYLFACRIWTGFRSTCFKKNDSGRFEGCLNNVFVKLPIYVYLFQWVRLSYDNYPQTLILSLWYDR